MAVWRQSSNNPPKTNHLLYPRLTATLNSFVTSQKSVKSCYNIRIHTLTDEIILLSYLHRILCRLRRMFGKHELISECIIVAFISGFYLPSSFFQCKLLDFIRPCCHYQFHEMAVQEIPKKAFASNYKCTFTVQFAGQSP